MKRLILVLYLLLFHFTSLQGQVRFECSAGFELEESPSNLFRRTNLLKKQVRLEVQSPVYKRLNASLGIRFSYTNEVFFEMLLIFPRPSPGSILLIDPASIVTNYAFSSRSLAVPIGLSFDLGKQEVFPISIYTNLEPVFNWKHYDHLFTETSKGPSTSLSLEAGFELPIVRMKHIALFFSPYLRVHNTFLAKSDPPFMHPSVQGPFEEKMVRSLGLRLGLSIY